MDPNEKLSKISSFVYEYDEDGSRSDGKGILSDDDVYLSGREEFETAPDNPVAGESGGEENSDSVFVDAPSEAECLLVSGAINDDDVEKRNMDVVAGGRNASRKFLEGGFAADDISGVDAFDGNCEILDSVDKLDVNSEVGVAGSDVENLEIAGSNGGKLVMKGVYEVGEEIESLNSGDELMNESKSNEVAEASVIALKTGEDCVVDANQFDVVSGVMSVVDSISGIQIAISSNGTMDVENIVKKRNVEGEPAVASEAVESGITVKIVCDGELVDKIEKASIHVYNGILDDDVSEETKRAAFAEAKAVHDPRGYIEVEDEVDKEVDGDFVSCGDTDDMIFESSEAAKNFIEELDRASDRDSHTSVDSSFEHPQRIDGQLDTDYEEEGATDDEEDGKELFDSAALAALLEAAARADHSEGGNLTITSQDGARLFSVERFTGQGSSLRALRPAPGQTRANIFNRSVLTDVGESEDKLSEEEKRKLEKLQQIRVKFLRLVHRLGLSTEESVAAQVLYRLALLGGRQVTQTFNLDAAKRMALQLEADERDDLDFSVNLLVLGKSGVGKSATINSIFGEDKAPIDAFRTGTASVKEISGLVDGVKLLVVDTPGLKPSIHEQYFNRGVLSSVKKFTNKRTTDVVLYVDRLDSQSRDLNDLPLLKTVTSVLGPSIWQNAVVAFTHAASALPDGPNGTPMSYEALVTQKSHVMHQSIGHAVGDLRTMSPSLMNPMSLVENHPSCRKNREGEKILPSGQSWRHQLLLLCYSIKILSEASSASKPQEPFDHRKLFGFRGRSPPLAYMLSTMLQSRPHPKLPFDQGGDDADSDIDLDNLSDSDQEEDDEYDMLPPFKPLKKAQLAKLSKEQRKAYFEEYDYRVRLLQKKQWREEPRRLREIKKKGKSAATDHDFDEDYEPDSGAAASAAVPLPDMALPPSFDGDNPTYRYRFLQPTSQFLARPVLDSHGWDHDCGYDGVNVEHSLAIANRFPAAFTVQITKDKNDFTISLDSSISAKHGENASSMACFDVQTMGKQVAYIIRGETKIKNLKKNKATGGISLTFLGENVIPGLKVEDQITLGKQYVLVGSAGAVRSQNNAAYGANIELQRREVDYSIGPVQSTLSMSLIKWRGGFALGLNSLAQFSIGRNSKVAVRAGINNKLSGQVTVRTSSSEHVSLALAAIVPAAISIFKKIWPGAGEN